MSLRVNDVAEIVEGGASTFAVVEALILALCDRDDAGDTEDANTLSRILGDLHGEKQ